MGELEAIKDAFDLVTILEIHNRLVETHVGGGGLDRHGFRQHFAVVNKVLERVRGEMVQDGNAAVYYKAAGEMFILGDDCARGKPLLVEAVKLLAVETSIDTSGLIQASIDLVAF